MLSPERQVKFLEDKVDVAVYNYDRACRELKATAQEFDDNPDPAAYDSVYHTSLAERVGRLRVVRDEAVKSLSDFHIRQAEALCAR